jgi:hypothetical protein
MPIRGLTDRPASFPEIGSVRKGAPKPEDGKKPGADLKHFRVEFDQREQKSAAVFAQIYGAQPAEINILFPFNEQERNFDAWREAYTAGALVHRCDGERVWYEIDPRTGERLVVNGEPLKGCDGRAGCKPVGRMKVIIPELQRLAYLVVHTTSIHDIINLSRQLEALTAINGGRLAGIPLKLRRRPADISMPGQNGKRVRREKWLLSVEADPEWVAAKVADMKRLALPELAQLPAPAVVDQLPQWTHPALAAGADDDDDPEGPPPATPANGHARAPDRAYTEAEIGPDFDQTPAGPPPTPPARTARLLDRLGELKTEAVALGLVGPGWAVDPATPYEQVVEIGKDLAAKIALARSQKQTEAP